MACGNAHLGTQSEPLLVESEGGKGDRGESGSRQRARQDARNQLSLGLR